MKHRALFIESFFIDKLVHDLFDYLREWCLVNSPIFIEKNSCFEKRWKKRVFYCVIVFVACNSIMTSREAVVKKCETILVNCFIYNKKILTHLNKNIIKDAIPNITEQVAQIVYDNISMEKNIKVK